MPGECGRPGEMLPRLRSSGPRHKLQTRRRTAIRMTRRSEGGRETTRQQTINDASAFSQPRLQIVQQPLEVCLQHEQLGAVARRVTEALDIHSSEEATNDVSGTARAIRLRQ